METSTKTAALERMLAYTIKTIDDDLGINIPQELGSTMSRALLPGLLRKVRLSKQKDGSPFPIYSDTQRNFAKLYVHLVAYMKEANEENRASATFHTSLYSRTVFQSAVWKCHLAANSRDAESTSSAYLIGIPHSGLDGQSVLRSWEIGISKYTARKLGVRAGEVIQLRRFPETNTIPMIVIIADDIGEHCIGLPVGSLLNTRLKTKDVPSLLGGDCDGDTYVITAYHEAYYSLFRNRKNYLELKAQMHRCLAELRTWFSEYWKDIPEYPVPTGIAYTWKDEDPATFKPRTDADVFSSKVMQKISIGSSTNTILSLCVAKLVRYQDFANVSWEDIRRAGERSTETCMDMKKDEGRDPLCFHNILCGNRSFDSTAALELMESGFNLDSVTEILTALKGVSVRKIARYNKAWAALLSDRRAFEALVKYFQDTKGNPEDFAKYFVDALYGFVKTPFIKGKGDPMEFPPTRMPREANDPNFELRFIELTDSMEEIRVTSLLHKGDLSVQNIPDSEDKTTSVLRIECDTVGGIATIEMLISNNGLVIELENRKVILRRTVLVPFHVKGRDMKIVPGSPRMLSSWGEVLGALLNTNFRFQINELKSLEDISAAEPVLADLINSALRYLLASYEVQNSDVVSYATASGQAKIVVLDNKIPEISKASLAAMRSLGITPASNNPLKLDEIRRTLAAEFLVKHGFINRMVDTLSGQPGMGFYAKTSPGRTYATEQFVLPQYAPEKRSPVMNACSNLIEFVGSHPVSFDLEGRPEAPTAEVWAISLPIELMDALLVSDSLSDTFQAKVYQPQTGDYKVYPLQDGQKLQGIEVDIKGVGKLTPTDNMPWIRLANGQMIRSEIVFQMGSKSHQQLRQTHFRMCLEAVARVKFLKTGERMRVPADLNTEQIAKVCVESGLYDSDDLTVEILSPDKSKIIGRYPAGVIALGMHTQIPVINASVHSQELYDEEVYATSTSSGGVVSGMMGAMTMRAYGLTNCLQTLHSDVPPALASEIAALLRCVERRSAPVMTEPSDLVYTQNPREQYAGIK